MAQQLPVAVDHPVAPGGAAVKGAEGGGASLDGMRRRCYQTRKLFQPKVLPTFTLQNQLENRVVIYVDRNCGNCIIWT